MSDGPIELMIGRDRNGRFFCRVRHGQDSTHHTYPTNSLPRLMLEVERLLELELLEVPPPDPRYAWTATTVREQVTEIRERHLPFNSPAEVYGVLAEEVAEFFDEVRKKPDMRSKLAMCGELIDVAAVAIRAAAELDDSRWGDV